MGSSSDETGFGMVPKALRGQTPYVIAVYAVLSMRWGSGSTAYPSHATLAEETGASVSTVKRALATLRDLGFIEWEPRSDGKGGRTSNLYRLTIGHGVSLDTPQVTVTDPPGQAELPPRSQGPMNKNQMNKNQMKGERATAWPEGFTPDEGLREWTRKNAPDIDPRLEWEQFRDNAIAKGLKYADWRRAWMTWARRGQQFALRDKARFAAAPVENTDYGRFDR